MKGLSIVKRAVVSLGEAAEIGKIENIVFDREARVAALIVKRQGRARELVATDVANIRSVGRDAVTIEDSALVEGTEKVEELRSWPNLRQLVGCRVITEGGTYLGQVRDVVLDEEGRRITEFELIGRGVIGRLHGDSIPATGRLRFGMEIVIVPNAVALKGKAVLEGVGDVPSPATPFAGSRQITNVSPIREVVLATNHETSQSGNGEEESLTRAVGG